MVECTELIQLILFQPASTDLFLEHLRAADRNYKHDTDILSRFMLMWRTCYETKPFFFNKSKVIIHLELCLWPADESKSNIHSLCF